MSEKASIRFAFREQVRRTGATDKHVIFIEPRYHGISHNGLPPSALAMIDLLHLPLITQGTMQLPYWERDLFLDELVAHTGPLTLEYHLGIGGIFARMHPQYLSQGYYGQVEHVLALFEELASDNPLTRITVTVSDMG